MDSMKNHFKKRLFFVENIGRNMLPCMINLQVGKEASFLGEIRKIGWSFAESIWLLKSLMDSTKTNPLFLYKESVFVENFDKNKFPCMIYLLPDRI